MLDACSPAPLEDPCAGGTALDETLRAIGEIGERAYVGIAVDGGDELAPRFAIGAVPFARFSAHAARADVADIAYALDGFEPADYLLMSDADDFLRTSDADDFLRAGDPIDADTVGGFTAEELLATGGGGDGLAFSDDATVWNILFGPAPATDADLLQLAHALDDIERQVTQK